MLSNLSHKRLSQDIAIIKSSLKVFDYSAILLYGAYGRDEGSWIVEKDGTCFPYNDYDILLVLNKKIPEDLIEPVRKKLAQEVGIHWIDIDQKTPRELRKLHPSIYSYDLKYASKVIDGDCSLLNLIPEIDPSTLPLKEGDILFFTRLWTLLGLLDKKGFNVDRNGEESRFFRNQMAKAILAVVDILLLQKGAYHPSYKERVKRLKNLYPEKSRFYELTEWALEEKLFPKAPNMTAKELEKFYQKVHYYFFSEMFHLLTQYYGRKVESPKAIESYLKFNIVNLIKRIGWVILRRNLDREKKIAVNIAQAYIAAAYRKKDRRKFLKRGLKFMRFIDKSLPAYLSWDEARVLVAKMRMEV